MSERLQTPCGQCWNWEPDDPKDESPRAWGRCRKLNASRTRQMQVVLFHDTKPCFLPNFVTVLREALPKEKE